MYKQLYVLQSGKKIMVERGWKKRVYHPSNFSLRRCIRILLKSNYGTNKVYKGLFHVSSTTSGWEHFDSSPSTSSCSCNWHLIHCPEKFLSTEVDA